jgi:hypothetical protein
VAIEATSGNLEREERERRNLEGERRVPRATIADQMNLKLSLS